MQFVNLWFIVCDFLSISGSPPPPPLPRSAPPPLDDNDSSSGTSEETEELETCVDDVDNQQPSLSSNEDNTINGIVTDDHDSLINHKTSLPHNDLDTIYRKIRQNDLNNSCITRKPCPPIDYDLNTDGNKHCTTQDNNQFNSLEDEEDYCVPIECDGSASVKKGGPGATAPRPTWLKPSLDRIEGKLQLYQERI